jgi:hypothetical protein
MGRSGQQTKKHRMNMYIYKKFPQKGNITASTKTVLVGMDHEVGHLFFE